MERESFEDDGTAELLNRGFVSIKVDREERPDVDKVYVSCASPSNCCLYSSSVYLVDYRTYHVQSAASIQVCVHLDSSSAACADVPKAHAQ